MAIVFEGKKLAEEKEEQLKLQLKKLKRPPKLVAVMIGENPASELYLQVKEKAAKRAGILFEKKKFSAEVKPEEIVKFIRGANKDSSVHGVMVQLPLSQKFEIRNSKFEILGSIEPTKDVDCLTPENLGLLLMGQPRFLPATVKAVSEILREAARNTFFAHECKKKIKDSDLRSELRHKFAQKDYFATSHFLEGRKVVIIGAGRVVGLPLAVHLKNLGATVTVCDEFTKGLAEHTRKAEILISATGTPRLIKKEMVKRGAVVIDVGSPEGDVDFEEVKKVASAMTPVPGGVGPLTVISLLENVLLAAQD